MFACPAVRGIPLWVKNILEQAFTLLLERIQAMIDMLNNEFQIPNAVTIAAGNGDLPKVVLTHASGSSAEVYLHGAHVTSWKNPAGEELFFLSRESQWAAHKPIRGGIPVIFPQFGGRGPLPQHGLVRTTAWNLIRTEVFVSGIVAVEFEITQSAESFALWPHDFVLGLRVFLDENALTVGMKAVNTGDLPFDFQAALHTYFAVADIGKVAIGGLNGATLIDALKDWERWVETREAIRFAGETDRIYVDTPDALRLRDEGNGRTIAIEKTDMPEVVVWNPWIEKSQRMADFGDDEYQRMVCIETGTIETRPTLFPDEKWEGETTLTFGGKME